jgi:hypothetical protein
MFPHLNDMELFYGLPNVGLLLASINMFLMDILQMTVSYFFFLLSVLRLCCELVVDLERFDPFWISLKLLLRRRVNS